MTRRFVDLSVELDDLPSERVPVTVERFDHLAGARQMSELFGVPAGDLPGGLGWAGETVRLGTHSGTHMDAPFHYGPSSNGGRARFISEVPLEWCFGPGVVLDLCHLGDGDGAGPGELAAALAAAGHRLEAGDIVLLRTGAARAWGLETYPETGCGLDRDGLHWLLDRGVRVVGTDGWSLDRPFGAMRRDYERTGDPAVLWPCHFAGRERPYCQIEKLTGLERLPAAGFSVLCFPIKVARASAGWVRVVAMLDDGGSEP